jgi:hypothetical protein
MRGKAAGAAAVGLVGAFVVVGPGVAGNDDFRNKYEDTTASESCDSTGGAGVVTDTVEYSGPLKLWPPNHKLQDLTFVATNGGGDVATQLVVTAQVLDSLGGDGGLQHDPDFIDGAGAGTDSATAVAQARSERSGKGEGRTYTVTARGLFDESRTCELTVVITVPHDMRGGADWK